MNTPDVKRFFTDLYRDLADRHLLLPALLLVVAIIAVPMLLGGGSAEPALPTAVPAPVAGADATAVESAVLAGDPGIRDYSKRLEALKKKNPFVQQFASSGDAAPADPAAELSAGSPTAESAALTDPTSGASTGTATETTGTVTEPTTGGGTTPTTPSDPTEPVTQPVPEPQVRFFAPRVDVTFGELGDTNQIENVRYFDFLPRARRKRRQGRVRGLQRGRRDLR